MKIEHIKNKHKLNYIKTVKLKEYQSISFNLVLGPSFNERNLT